MNKVVLLLFFVSSSFIFSQSKLEDILLEKDIKKICPGNETNFHKTHVFFFKNKIDSSYVYANQAISDLGSYPVLKDYTSYLYAICADKKGFSSLAKTKLEEDISPSFKYRFLVDFRLGYIAQNRREFKSAIEYFKLALSAIKSKGFDKEKSIYHNLGACNLLLENFDESYFYLQKDLNISLKDKDTLGIIYAKIDLGNLYYEQYKDEIAIKYFKEAYKEAGLFSDIKSKQMTAKNMAVVEKNRKKYKSSVAYFVEAEKWKDSLWNRDKISELLEKDKQIAVAIKNKEIVEEKAISKRQKDRVVWFGSALAVVLLFFAILYYFYRVKSKQHKIINLQKGQLEELNTTKNYLFSVVSHDLRSPVNHLVKQQSKLMAQLNAEEIKQAKRTSNIALTLTKSLQHLLNNVLHWSLEQNKQSIFILKECQLNRIIKEVVFDYMSIADAKNIRLQISADKDIVVLVDRESLKIVIRNFIDNALKYTADGGEINITSKIEKNNYCRIEIEDTGMGIPGNQLSKIRELKEISVDKIDRSNGIGLGLLLCVSLIKKNNGILEVDSVVGAGSNFKITLPMVVNS